jgi:hypothetical protein
MTPLTDELLRRRLETRAAADPAISLSAIARSVADRPRRRPAILGWRARASVLGSAAAAVVVGVSLIAVLVGRAGLPAVAASPSDSSDAPVATGPVASGIGPSPQDVAPAWESIAWETTERGPFASDQTTVTDVIAVGDGFLAIGTTMNGGVSTGRAWLSADGRTWERVDAPGLEAMQPRRVLNVGKTLVVLGLEGSADEASTGAHTVLASSTDERTWLTGPALPVPGDPRLAAGGPPGLLMPVGQDEWLLGPGLTTWTKSTTGSPDVLLGTPAWANGRWIQPGTTGVDANGDPSRAVVWTSADGSKWDLATVQQPAGGMFSVLAAASGMIGIGTADDVCLRCFGRALSSTAIWASNDGRDWRRIGLSAEVFPRGPGLQFAADGQRIVVLGQAVAGSSPGTGRMLSETLDGTAWHVLEQRGVQPEAAQAALAVGPHGVAVVGIVSTRSFAGVFGQAWWGAAAEAPPASADGTTGPSTGSGPSGQPLIAGCDTLGFDARRCAAVVARAMAQAGNPTGVVAIALGPVTFDPTSLGSQPLASVGFTLADGTTKTVEFRCMDIGNASDLACSGDPQIGISNGVSHDVPCPNPCDDNHPGATLPPSPKPAVVAASTPLALPAFDVPIDHVGHYEIVVGSATLPDGLLSERSGELADTRPTAYWIDRGVQIVVRPGPPCTGSHCPEIDSIYHAPFHGPQPVNVYLVFDVTELNAPGAVLEVRNLVVR